MEILYITYSMTVLNAEIMVISAHDRAVLYIHESGTKTPYSVPVLLVL